MVALGGGASLACPHKHPINFGGSGHFEARADEIFSTVVADSFWVFFKNIYPSTCLRDTTQKQCFANTVTLVAVFSFHVHLPNERFCIFGAEPSIDWELVKELFLPCCNEISVWS